MKKMAVRLVVSLMQTVADRNGNVPFRDDEVGLLTVGDDGALSVWLDGEREWAKLSSEDSVKVARAIIHAVGCES